MIALYLRSVGVQTPTEQGRMKFNSSQIKPPRKDVVQSFPDVTDFERSQEKAVEVRDVLSQRLQNPLPVDLKLDSKSGRNYAEA